MVHKFEPSIRLCVDSSDLELASDSVSPFPSAPPLLVLFLSVSKINKTFFKLKKKVNKHLKRFLLLLTWNTATWEEVHTIWLEKRPQKDETTMSKERPQGREHDPFQLRVQTRE